MTWMHMMNNNASKEGLTKDLQGLADAGVGGALVFSVKQRIADGRVAFNSSEWREILVHGAKEAERLGLKLGVHNCDGWTSSGGPWVKIEDSMKQVVCSDTVVKGGKVAVTLPQPATFGGFYRDIAVLAYPATSEELEAFQNPPTLTGSAKAEELEKLTDGQLDTEAMFATDRSTKGKPWLLFAYAKPFPARSIHVGHRNGKSNAAFDNLTAGGQADIPMGEFWLDSDRYITDSAVSAARTYGKPIISAESFTSWAALNWKVHPWLMKRSGDTGWIQGINEFMFHRFAHQANPHVAPGMTMGSIGSHIDRTQTWWLNAGKAWMKYLQRGQWLLRQGVPVSDLLVYVGEGTPHSLPGRSTVKLPNGYNMDHCDKPVLMQRIRVQDGKLVLPEGTAYSVLLLSNSKQMSLATLARVKELAQAGAVIVGPKPVEPIGYLERTSKQAEFRALADELWGDANKPKPQGKGWIILGEQWPADVEAVRIAPDLIIKDEPKAAFIHRRIGSADVYFLQNRETNSRTLHCSFRVADRIPELWHADTGTTERQAQFAQVKGRTEVPITLEGHGSVFVVFREAAKGFDSIAKVECQGTPARMMLDKVGAAQLCTSANGIYQLERASGKRQEIRITDMPAPQTVGGSWQATFAGPGLKGPQTVTFETLTDWKDHPREDLRHFSGTAAYRRSIEVPGAWLGANKRVHLDLGRVEICAEVFVNGRFVRTLWKPPFSLDVTDFVHAGANAIEIKVTNLWSNRLIGDEALKRTDGYDPKEKMPDWFVKNRPMPAGPRSTFTTFNFYKKNDDLLSSGLLGPVTLFLEARVTIK